MEDNPQSTFVTDFSGIASCLAPVTVVCGHYGVGKTSLSVSLAIDAVRAGYDVVLSDMDVVNPYFRSSDYKGVLDEAGVKLIEPVYARSNVDGPSITNETAGAIEWARETADVFFDAAEKAEQGGDRKVRPRLLLIDAGGDDSGATVLGRFSAAIKASAHEMLYVVNLHRGFNHTPSEASAFMREIEEASHLQCTGVVGNTHLKGDTTLETVSGGVEFAARVAAQTQLPLKFATMPQSLAAGIIDRQSDCTRQMHGSVPVYAMGIYVRAPWE
ncbi:MAG TPA: ParA family protein [Candidatus Aphodovivens excrementavium]|nr:ParA family protein [Candidatus Aphodovivens excrementavium]